MQPIVTLTLPFEEAREVYRALIARYFVEDALRREQGLEPISVPVLAERFEKILGFSTEESATETKRVEDELWQHAWLTFTDEWAWHRAKRDILKELGETGVATLSHDQLEQLTERRYEAQFDAYTKEIQLPGHEAGASCEWPSKTTQEHLPKNQKPSRHS